MRRFGKADMWNARNEPSGIRETALEPAELPVTAYAVTEESGVRMSELSPLYLANRGGLVMTTATDYGTLHAAGRQT